MLFLYSGFYITYTLGKFLGYFLFGFQTHRPTRHSKAGFITAKYDPILMLVLVFPMTCFRRKNS